MPPEAQPEIERILDYLRVQRDLGQPMHFMIERDINKPGRAGLPREKVEEVKRWVYMTDKSMEELEKELEKEIKELGGSQEQKRGVQEKARKRGRETKRREKTRSTRKG